MQNEIVHVWSSVLRKYKIDWIDERMDLFFDWIVSSDHILTN